MKKYFTRLLRLIKNYFVSPDVSYRKILFGPAHGFFLLMSRRSGLRMELGLFERPIKQYIKEFSKDAKVVYDLGAAEGYYILAFARCLGISGKIVAFEPDLAWKKYLEGTVARNNLSGRVEIIYSSVIEKSSNENEVSLDSLVKDYKLLPPDILKIDIEGAELKALKGARLILIDYHPKIILEVHTKELKIQCREFLEKIGYTVYDVPIGLFERIFPEVRDLENSWQVAF